MKDRQPKNVSASVQDRLKNIARREGISYNIVLLLYFQERFLFRLSLSKYSSKFILKGGLLRIFRDICDIDYPDDGVHFEASDPEMVPIAQGGQYRGSRLKVPGFLGNVRQNLQIDIGFGDVVVPKPQVIAYPILLEGLEGPSLTAYSLESVIAEKFEIMLRLASVNSRMKDFFDIFSLLSTNNFEGRVLQESIAETISRRGTGIERNPIIFSTEFSLDSNKKVQWEAFLRRSGIEYVGFPEVMIKITNFLKPVYDVIVNECEFFKNWHFETLSWN